MAERFLRLPEVIDRCGLGSSSIYKRIADGEFPAGILLGKSRRFLESEIDTWIAERIAESRKAA